MDLVPTKVLTFTVQDPSDQVLAFYGRALGESGMSEQSDLSPGPDAILYFWSDASFSRGPSHYFVYVATRALGPTRTQVIIRTNTSAAR